VVAEASCGHRRSRRWGPRDRARAGRLSDVRKDVRWCHCGLARCGDARPTAWCRRV